MARQVPTRFVLPAQEVALPARSIASATERLEDDRKRRRWERIRQLRGIQLYDVFPSIFGVKKAELAIFSRQLATLIAAGVPLRQSIHVLHAATRSKQLTQRLVALPQGLTPATLRPASPPRCRAPF